MKISVYILSVLFLVCGFGWQCREEYKTANSKSVSNAAGDSANTFIPPGYVLLQEEKGLLNDDSLTDCILILSPVGEDSLSDSENPKPRRVQILYGRGNDRYIANEASDSLIYYFGYDLNFREAFVSLSIDKQQFTINHYGGFRERWGRSTTFARNPAGNTWYVYADEWNFFDAINESETFETYLFDSAQLRAKPLSQFSIYADVNLTQAHYTKGE